MGAYIAVKPQAKAVNDLSGLKDWVDLPFYPPEEYHITTIFCKDPTVDWRSYEGQVNPKQEFKVQPLQTDRWQDTKGRWIIVLPIMSADLVKRNAYLTTQGLVHSFPSFRPHITLTEPLPKEMPLAHIVDCQRIIDNLLRNRVWYFDNEHIEEARNYPPLLIDPMQRVPIKKLKLVGYEEAKSKLRKRKGSKGSVGKPPEHNPELTEQEEWSMRRHGFNAEGVKHRVATTGPNHLQHYLTEKPPVDPPKGKDKK